jgi:hypothetical protein
MLFIIYQHNNYNNINTIRNLHLLSLQTSSSDLATYLLQYLTILMVL